MAIRMDANGTHRQNGTETLTFALGDVVGSTQLWEQHPDEMPRALARIDALVEDELTHRTELAAQVARRA